MTIKAEFPLALEIVRAASAVNRVIHERVSPELEAALMHIALTCVWIQRELEAKGLTAERSRLLGAMAWGEDDAADTTDSQTETGHP